MRLSVTDRCDLRCTYCLAENPVFLPKQDFLSLEELTGLADAFIRRGVRKIRITGGEPLVRRGVISLIEALSTRIGHTALEEVCLTTNATQLEHHAHRLARAGVRRVNISLDTLDPVAYRRLTRNGKLERALAGIDAAQDAGMKIKINTVALLDENEHYLEDLIVWAHGRGFDLSLIEVMPLGQAATGRGKNILSLKSVRERLEQSLSLTDLPDRTGGPSDYVKVHETGGRLGFISPLSRNFCGRCNRVRLSCTGKLYTCLGQAGSIDLGEAWKIGGLHEVDARIDRALQQKPAGHEFTEHLNGAPAIDRSMAHTGG